MKHTLKTQLQIVASVLFLGLTASVFAHEGSSQGHGQGHGHGHFNKLYADLDGTVQDGASGEIYWYSDGVAKSGLKAEVTIPVPATALGVLDSNTAAASSVVLTLSRGGALYATCTLPISEMNFENNNGVYTEYADYVVSVHSDPKKANSAFGDCTDGTNPIIPAVQFGDTADVAIGVTPFLSGAF